MPKTTRTSTDRKRRLPYLKKVGQRGRIAIWQVDGSYIRTQHDPEFDNYAQHFDFDFIPENEFWLDQEADPDEANFFIERMAFERWLRRRGVDAERASVEADKAERTWRRRDGDVKKVTPPGQLPDAHQVHSQLWKKLESGVSVWIVNGRLVRSAFDVNFTSGGHDHVYEYIPTGEVWIDDDNTDVERPYALIHELHERHLMEAGQTYAAAHEAATRLEAYCRHHPEELHSRLEAEGW